METTTVNLLMEDLLNEWRTMVAELHGTNLNIFSEDTLEQSKKIHNKLAMSVLTKERYILSITGLQGAGKTTVLNRLYELESDYLPENLSRGEQLPILITENNVEKEIGYIYFSHFDDVEGFTIRRKSLSPEEFNNIAKNPRNEHIWLELFVPFRFFHDSKKSLALLPGFEAHQGRSQELLTHLLYLSTSSVCIFRKDTYARDTNEKMLQRVKVIFEGLKPIYVLTHGDINPEQNETIRKQAEKDFDITNVESDRLIISGDSESYSTDWKTQLIRAIEKYGYVTDTEEDKKLAMLEELFSEMQEFIHPLREALELKEEKQLYQKALRSNNDKTYIVIDQFESEYEKFLTEVEEKVGAALRSRIKGANKHFNQFVENNTGFWKNVTERFSPKALEKQEKIEKAINDAWINAREKEPEAEVADIVTSHIEQYHQQVNQQGGINVSKTQRVKAINLDDEDSTVDESDRSREEDNSTKGISSQVIEEEKNSVTEESLQNINNFFDRDSKELITLTKKDTQTMTLIGGTLARQSIISKPVLEIEAARQSNMALDKDFLNAPSSSNIVDPVTKVEEFADQVTALSKVTPKILAGIPLILGVDVALDGDFDIVNGASTALQGLGISISSAQLLGVLGIGFAGMFAAHAIQVSVQETNKRQLALSQAGHQALDQLPDIHTKAIIHSLRRIFEQMNERLYETHSEKIGVYQNDEKIERLSYRLNRIAKKNGELHQMVINHAGYFI